MYRRVCVFFLCFVFSSHSFWTSSSLDVPTGATHWSMVICQGSTRSELPWGLLALSRRTLGSERLRYAIAWPDKLGTDPMAYGGFIMDAAAELGRNPVSKHQIQPEYGDEQADAGRNGWTRLARPNSQARTGTGECSFPQFSWPRAGLATLPGWSILCYMWWPYINTYIHRRKVTQDFSSTFFLRCMP